MIEINWSAIRDIESSEYTGSALQRIGDQVAQRAAQAAPKRTGAGAASIRAEVVTDSSGDKAVHISWDADHEYMFYQEHGDSEMPARPFLRPALDAHYDL